ncbi:MAG: hypothetical protein AAF677_01480 [Pseudomonadota bacterium]
MQLDGPLTEQAQRLPEAKTDTETEETTLLALDRAKGTAPAPLPASPLSIVIDAKRRYVAPAIVVASVAVEALPAFRWVEASLARHGFRRARLVRHAGHASVALVRGTPEDTAEGPDGWSAVTGVVAVPNPARALLALVGTDAPGALSAGRRQTLASDWNGNWGGVAITPRGMHLALDHAGSHPFFATDHARFAGIRLWGTSLNEIAEAAGRQRIDPISADEFVAEGSVSWPHTLYAGIHRLREAAVHAVLPGDDRAVEARYWEPAMPAETASLDDVAGRVAEAMHRNVATIWARPEEKAVFYSGGVDSRFMVAVARRQLGRAPIRGMVMLHMLNREYALAAASARVLGLDLAVVRRPDAYFHTHFERTTAEIGAGFNALNVVSTGLIDGDPGTLYVNGWTADTFLKALYLPKRLNRRWMWEPDPDVRRPSDRSYAARRQAKVDRLTDLRGAQDAEAWLRFWPIADHHNFATFRGSYHGHKTVTPYMFGNMILASSDLTEAAKLNNALVQRAFRRDLGLAGWIPRSEGEIPNLPATLDRYAARAVSAGFWVASKLMRRVRRHYVDGPWENLPLLDRRVVASLAAADPDIAATVRRMAPAAMTNREARCRALQIVSLLSRGIVRVDDP